MKGDPSLGEALPQLGLDVPFPDSLGRVPGSASVRASAKKGKPFAVAGPDGSGIDLRVVRVCRAVEERLSERLTIPGLAAEVGLSLRRLGLLFRSDLGVTVKQYLNETRLLEARRLLRETFLRVSEVGYKVGFENPAHFSRSYRQRFGAPPRLERASVVEHSDRLGPGASSVGGSEFGLSSPLSPPPENQLVTVAVEDCFPTGFDDIV